MQTATAGQLNKSKDEKIKDLQRRKTICENIKRVVESEGWEREISPKIDEMISATIGGKQSNGLYNHGAVMNDKDHSSEYHFGYRKALMDLHNWIIAKARNVETFDKQLKDTNDGPKKSFVSRPKTSYEAMV